MTKSSDYKDNVDPIARQLRETRIERGVKQKDVAGALGMHSESSLSAYENGQVVPKIDFVRDWATALDYELVLKPVEKPTRGRRRADTVPADGQSDDIPDGLVQVHLSPYQTALAMGILLGQAGTMRTDSPGMAADLQVISDILRRSIH